MSTWRVGLVAGVLVGWAGCNGRPGPQVEGQRPTPEPAPAAVKFLLRANGLPTEGNWKCDPVFADVNRDGRLDLIAIPRLGDGPRVWLNDGQGNWQESAEGLDPGLRSCGGGLAVGDIDCDGNLDLAVADHCQGVFVYLGDGAGHWEMTTRELYPTDLVAEGAIVGEFVGAEDLDLGDANGDGFLDILASASDEGGIVLYLGDGTGKNWQRLPGDLPATGWANRVMFADVNGDKRLDVVAAHSDGPRVWLGDGKGGWTAASKGLPSPSMLGLFRGLAVGDINEDGRPDIAIANWIDGPEVYLQQTDGSWRKTADPFPGMRGGAAGLTLGDIDRDGHLDMFVSGRLLGDQVGYVYGVYFLRGDGRGSWTHARDCGLPEGGLPFTWGLATADFDGDRVPDLAAGSGGVVATSAEHAQPALPAGLLVWSTRLQR